MAHEKLPETEQFLFGVERRSSHFLGCGYSFRSPLKRVCALKGQGRIPKGRNLLSFIDVEPSEWWKVIVQVLLSSGWWRNGHRPVGTADHHSPGAQNSHWNFPTPSSCGDQLFPHLCQEITAEFPVIFPDLMQSRIFGVRLTCGFKLAKTRRRFLTLGWLILKALAQTP